LPQGKHNAKVGWEVSVSRQHQTTNPPSHAPRWQHKNKITQEIKLAQIEAHCKGKKRRKIKIYLP